MIRSMTGFGKAQLSLERGTIIIDIRALNSKQLDVNMKIPLFLREQESEIRNMLSSTLERGKIDVLIQFKNSGIKSSSEVNTEMVLEHFQKLQIVKDRLGLSNDVIFSEIMKMPDVFGDVENKIDDAEWELIRTAIKEALESADDFRRNEGAGLKTELISRVASIEQHLDSISRFEDERIQTIRQRLKSKIDELLRQDAGSSERFEEEMIYFLEKLDVSEEKQRLGAHCKYFRETSESVISQGRKLGFITQEMGREINTIGSKANHSEMQKVVVLMKDELEKIKEQLNNIL